MNKQKSFDKGYTLGTLYLVPTPIGNLEDMSVRCLRTLKEVALIASEDTRNTQKLLNYFDISTAQKSFHEHNYKERIPQLLAYLNNGQDVAQVSDAGMPSISDPGHELVKACIAEGMAVVALPGPTAGVTALIASGLTPQPHLFYGFLPRKKKEQLLVLKELQQERSTLIFYESPYRVAATLTTMHEAFGGEREVVICRELTKIHEEYIRGTIHELVTYLASTELKGECCLLVAGFSGELPAAAEEAEVRSYKEQVQLLVDAGQTSKAAIKEIAQRNQVKKQVVYRDYHELDTE